MKRVLKLFLFCIVTTTFGQKKNNSLDLPFQVIYAENVVNNEGLKIKELDFISINDVLVVGSEGFLSMIHFTGFPIEISNDSTVNIMELNSLLDASKKRKKNQLYFNHSYNNIDYLFITNPIQGRKGKLSASGACHDCNFDLEIIYPPKFSSNIIYFKTDLCIIWQNTGSRSYEIELRNLHEDLLSTFTSTTNSLTINTTALKSFKKSKNPILLRIKDLTSQKMSEFCTVQEFSKPDIDFPYSCNLYKPTYALLTGLYLELSSRDYIKEAEQYFELATKLSNKEFYKTMLNNFKNRRK